MTTDNAKLLTSRDGLHLNLALLRGDMPTFFALLADYLVENRLHMPPESLALFAERGLLQRPN